MSKNMKPNPILYIGLGVCGLLLLVFTFNLARSSNYYMVKAMVCDMVKPEYLKEDC